MRTMLRVTIPVEAGNKAIKEGSLNTLLKSALETLKPEAAYFLADKGTRTALIFFDLRDSSQIPVVAEPLFTGLSAAVEFIPVMNADDLTAGLQRVGH